MNFLYKIYSGYDGFQPKSIPSRLIEGRYLQLGWKRYLDEVDRGDEVWVYFSGPHRFQPGVYVKGRVAAIEPNAEKEILLRVYRYDTSSPLTDARVTARIAAIVRARGRQVFFLPADWETVSECSVFSTALSCSQRRCEWCATWRSFGRIASSELLLPPKLAGSIETLVPAYWAIPPRCYLNSHSIRSPVHQVTQILKAFKTGNSRLAYPFARAMVEVFSEWGVAPEYDFVVPVPLSPDKAANGEIDRARLLAQEVAGLFGVPLNPLLGLLTPISKRRMLSAGYTYAQFVSAYRQALTVAEHDGETSRVLLVDDVCTHGGTLKVISEALRAKHRGIRLTATVAVQMVVKSVVADEASIRV